MRLLLAAACMRRVSTEAYPFKGLSLKKRIPLEGRIYQTARDHQTIAGSELHQRFSSIFLVSSDRP